MPRIIILLSLLSSTALGVPYELSYSGRLTNTDGSPITGSVTLDVSFWSAETNGTEYYDVPTDYSVGSF